MIGIFDSGVGGMTVLRAIRERLPHSDFIYFGDTRHAPYGSRSRDELSRLTAEGLALLERRGATSIVSACNSVSASLAVSLLDALALPPDRLIEMVGPTVRSLRDSSARLALAATPATIESGLYQTAFHMLGKELQAFAIPELAGAIEHGAPEEELDRIVREGVAGKTEGAELLILACTHYPLAAASFRKALPNVALFDPAAAVAVRVEAEFWPREAGDGKLAFLISGESERFRALAAELFPNTAFTVEVVE